MSDLKVHDEINLKVIPQDLYEIIYNLVSFDDLKNLLLVSKEINKQIQSSKILMRKIVYNIKNEEQTVTRQYLNFKIQCDDINDETLKNFKQNVESLEFLGSLKGSIDSRINSLENLKKLSIKNINFGSEEEMSIAWNLKSLTSLIIEASWKIQFNKQFKHLRNLENIELIDIKETINCEDLGCFLENQSHLKEVSLTKIKFNEDSKLKSWKVNNVRNLKLNETDGRIFHVIKNIKSLEKLHLIQGFDWISSEVVRFIEQQVNLKDLSIYDFDRNYNEPIIPCDGNFPLENLTLYTKSSCSLKCYELIENCKSTLKKFSFRGNFCRITKKSIDSIKM